MQIIKLNKFYRLDKKKLQKSSMTSLPSNEMKMHNKLTYVYIIRIWRDVKEKLQNISLIIGLKKKRKKNKQNITAATCNHSLTILLAFLKKIAS